MSATHKTSDSVNSSAHLKRSINDTLLPAPRISAEPDLPEGGFTAWCTVLGVFLSEICGFGYTSAFGVYQAFYAQQYLQNESPSAVSWIGSLISLLVTGLGPLCGPLFDRGYFYPVYLTGATLQSLSLFMLSLAQPGKYYQVFLAQGLASGIAQGLMYIPAFAVLSHHFKRRRATVMSISASGVAFGGVVNTIMLNKLLNGPMGFKRGVRISATFVTVLLFLSCILMRARYDAVRQKTTTFSFWRATAKCFTEIPSLLTIMGFTLFQAAYLYPFFYFQVDALRHGLGDSFSFYSLVIVNTGSFFGRFAGGLLVPFIGVIDLTIISTVACAVLIIAMIWLGSAASVVVLGLLYGLFAGINVGMMAPMLGLTSAPEELGVRMGVGFAITGIGGMIGPPIGGALLTNRYVWWAPATFCAAIALVGAGLFVGVRIAFARHVAGAARKCTDHGNERTIRDGCEKKDMANI